MSNKIADPHQVIDNFDHVKKLLVGSFEKIKDKPLYYVDVDRDEIWDAYLTGFAEADRQEHNCSACRSFLRQFGGIVTIGEDNQIVSIGKMS